MVIENNLMSDLQNKEYIGDYIRSSGDVFWGTASLSEKDRQGFLDIPPQVLENAGYAVSLYLPVSKGVLGTIIDRPTKLYYNHYRQLNSFLDRLANLLAVRIEEKGFSALPIPASYVVDWKNQYGHLSHKLIAVRAGLGWVGRNNLLVTGKYGARVRLATILTNMPLPAAAERENGCGACMKCVAACPAEAISNKQEDFQRLKCFEKLKEFSKSCNIGHYICGICVRECSGSV